MLMKQRTLKDEYKFEGIGLHSGQRSKLILKPAGPNHGIVFHAKHSFVITKIPYCIENVTDSNYSTTIGKDGVYVQTIEHLMSVLYALHIDNLDIFIEGDEVPALDGSALEFWIGINYVGLEFYEKFNQEPIKIKEPLEVHDGNSYIKISPCNHKLDIRCSIDFPNTVIGNQNIQMIMETRSFITEIMSAKTFGFMKDYDELLIKGLAQGSNPQNTIIIGNPNIINPNEMVHSDDFVRHKILDLMGDLSLLGRPLCGSIDSYCAGHSLNQKIVKKILDNC